MLDLFAYLLADFIARHARICNILSIMNERARWGHRKGIGGGKVRNGLEALRDRRDMKSEGLSKDEIYIGRGPDRGFKSHLRLQEDQENKGRKICPERGANSPSS